MMCMAATWKRPTSLISGIDFGVGAGEGRAAMCGHQSGDQGVWVEKPVSSLGDRKGCLVKDPLPGTSSNFSQWKVVEDV